MATWCRGATDPIPIQSLAALKLLLLLPPPTLPLLLPNQLLALASTHPEARDAVAAAVSAVTPWYRFFQRRAARRSAGDTSMGM